MAISGNIVRTVILSAAKNLVGAEGLASGPGDSSCAQNDVPADFAVLLLGNWRKSGVQSANRPSPLGL